jgi:hypothetical protein
MDFEKMQAAAAHLVDDLNMLMDGTWVPDPDTFQASIDNAVLLSEGLPVLFEQLRVVEENAARMNAAYDVLLERYMRATRMPGT